MQVQDERIFRARIVVPLCIVVALLIRLLAARSTELSLDEGYSTFFSQIPLRSIFLYAGLDSNPPIGNAFYHVWGHLVSYNVYLWRVPGIAASCITLLLVYRLLHCLVPERTSLLVTLGKAVSLCDVLYAQQIRVYPIAELFIVLSWVALKRFSIVNTRGSAIGWAFCGAMACHLHYVCLLVVAASWLVAAVYTGRHTSRTPVAIRRLVEAAALLGLLCTPLLYPLIEQVTVYKNYQWIESPKPQMLWAAAFQLSGYSVIALCWAMVLLYSVFVLKRPGVAATVAARYSYTVGACVGIIVLFTVLALIGSTLGGSFFYPRYFFYLQVPFLTLLMAGLLSYPRLLADGVGGVMIIALIFTTHTHLTQVAQSDGEFPPRGGIESPTGSSSRGAQKIFVHRTPCSFLRGELATRFQGTHLLLTDEAVSNVFRYPGVVTREAHASRDVEFAGDVVEVVPERCCGASTDVNCWGQGVGL